LNCIVIPVYKEFDKLDVNELISLKQCIKLLGKYPIWFTGPIDLDYITYINYFATNIVCNLNYTVFDKKYFKNIKGYNKLLCSSLFYERFSNYDYMLIYQLDAYVFRDELDYWANQNIDYIGAPWFENWDKPTNKKIVGVGNGGFSLRRIKKFIEVSSKIECSRKAIWYFNKKVTSNYRMYKIVVKILQISLRFKYKENSIRLIQTQVINEDTFWGFIVPDLFGNFKIATPEAALKFSFEVLPSYLFELNNHKLPFGCHAWFKHEPDFYLKHIV
jgi:hypothetical protein